jgi:hypothetical protein
VDVDPVKVDLPSPRSIAAGLSPVSREAVPGTENAAPTPKLDLTKNATSSRAVREQCDSAPIKRDRATTSGTPAPPSQTLRAGAKRKFGGDENDAFRIPKQADKQSKEGGAADKPRPGQDVQKGRTIKDSSAGKRDVKDRGGGTDAPVLNPRKPLAAKSTNDSPRKVVQPVGADLPKPPKKASTNLEEKIKQPASSAAEKPTSRPPKKSLPVVQIPLPQPALPAAIPTTSIAEPETPIPEPELLPPNTPDHGSAAATRDTPPPGMGEASRPSRRARPAISYAEPNLRDKMRRPTKELFDAVAGEGKFKARNSIAAPGTAQKPSDESGSAVRTASSSKGKENDRPEEHMSAAEMAVAKEASRRESALSPTPAAHQKDVSNLRVENEELPSTITTQRRKRGSSMGLSSMDGLVSSTTSTASLCFADKSREAAPPDDDINVYDFESSSPASAEKSEELKPVAGRAQARKSRASSSFQENGNGSLTSGTGVGMKQGGRGKRASMAAAMTKLSMLELEDTEESSLEGESVVKDRMSRRKSMML